MTHRILRSPADTDEQKPRLHWAALLFTVVTMLSAIAVGLTATDVFTQLTMAAGVIACIALWQTMRDPLVMASLTMVVLGAVLGWGMNFYDRIWWYDDFAHFSFSLLSVMAIGRLTLHRFRADTALLLMIALWLSWLGIGSLWEIAEWTSDQLQSTHHSRGYADTMADMVLNSTGSAIGVWAYWRWLRTPAEKSLTLAS